MRKDASNVQHPPQCGCVCVCVWESERTVEHVCFSRVREQLTDGWVGTGMRGGGGGEGGEGAPRIQHLGRDSRGFNAVSGMMSGFVYVII